MSRIKSAREMFLLQASLASLSAAFSGNLAHRSLVRSGIMFICFLLVTRWWKLFGVGGRTSKQGIACTSCVVPDERSVKGASGGILTHMSLHQ